MSLNRRRVAGTCEILPGRIINRHTHRGGWTTIKGINQEINTFKGGGVEGPPAPVVAGQTPLPKAPPPLRPLTLHQKIKFRVRCAGGGRGKAGVAPHPRHACAAGATCAALSAAIAAATSSTTAIGGCTCEAARGQSPKHAYPMCHFCKRRHP